MIRISSSIPKNIACRIAFESLNKLQSADLKLDARNRYIVHINPQSSGYSQTQLDALYRTIEQSFHALPGVKNVGLCTYTPMEDNNWDDYVQIQGQPPSGKSASWVRGNPEYFDSVGTRVIMGRGIGVQDTSTARASKTWTGTPQDTSTSSPTNSASRSIRRRTPTSSPAY